MIIFTPYPREVAMVVYDSNPIIYNLTSYINDFPMLNFLIPSLENIGFNLMETHDYEVAYIQYVTNTPNALMQFMSIMGPVYNEDKTVIIAINSREEDYKNIINECLSSAIARRYGYPSYYIYNPEDALYLTKTNFSVKGIVQMDYDIKRLEMVMPMDEATINSVLMEDD